MRPQFPVAVILLFSGLGCGKAVQAGNPASSTSKPAPLAADMQTLGGADYRINIPKSWLAFDTKAMDAAAIKAKMKGTEFAPNFDAIKGMLDMEMLRGFAFIPEFSNNILKANLNIIVLPAGGTASAVLDANEKQLKGLDPKFEIWEDFSTLPDSRAMLWGKDPLKTLSVVTIQKDKQFVMTLSMHKDTDMAKVKTVMKPIINSFVVK
ncbi:MAG: hypothetical protein ABL949_16950 [Fimbriimonadaceae bacterium]